MHLVIWTVPWGNATLNLSNWQTLITNHIRLTLTAGCFAFPWEMSILHNFRPISHAYLYSYFLPQPRWLLSFSCLLMSDSLWPHGLQHASLFCSSQSPGVCSNSYPLSQWCHPIISSFVSPSPTLNLFRRQGLFQSVSSSHPVAKVLEFQLQQQSFQWIFRVDFLSIDWFDLLAVQGTLSRVFFPKPLLSAKEIEPRGFKCILNVKKKFLSCSHSWKAMGFYDGKMKTLPLNISHGGHP